MRVNFQRLVLGMLALTLAFGASGNVAAAESGGRGQSQLLRKGYDSAVTGKRREYFLYLPVGYHTEQGKKWPVILFLHGRTEAASVSNPMTL